MKFFVWVVEIAMGVLLSLSFAFILGEMFFYFVSNDFQEKNHVYISVGLGICGAGLTMLLYKYAEPNPPTDSSDVLDDEAPTDNN